MPCAFAGRAKYARLTQVDECGRPFGFSIVDDCWPSLAVSAQVTEGTDINFTDAQGTNCATIPGCPSSGGDQLTWSFHHASPELFSIITGATLRMDDMGNVIGVQECDIRCREGFAFETWVETVGEECPEEGEAEGLWVYFLWPWVTGVRLGDYTIQNDALTFQVVGRSRAGSGWGVGPWDVHNHTTGPGPLFDPTDSSCDKPIIEYTTLGPPTDVLCELIPVPEESPAESPLAA